MKLEVARDPRDGWIEVGGQLMLACAPIEITTDDIVRIWTALAEQPMLRTANLQEWIEHEALPGTLVWAEELTKPAAQNPSSLIASDNSASPADSAKES
jgi:hypothetical protein